MRSLGLQNIRSTGIGGGASAISYYLPGTNLLTNPSDIIAPWQSTALSITNNSRLAPDGTLTSDLLLETAVSSEHTILQPVTKAASALPYYGQVWVKAANREWVALVLTNNAGTAYTYQYLLISTGALGTGGQSGFGVLTTTISFEADGWRRIIFSFTSDTDTTIKVKYLGATGVATSVYLGETNKGLEVWGSQLIQGSM